MSNRNNNRNNNNRSNPSQRISMEVESIGNYVGLIIKHDLQSIRKEVGKGNFIRSGDGRYKGIGAGGNNRFIKTDYSAIKIKLVGI